MSSGVGASQKHKIKELEKQVDELKQKYGELHVIVGQMSQAMAVQFGHVWANQQSISDCIDMHDQEILSLAKLIRQLWGKVDPEMTEQQWEALQAQIFESVREQIHRQKEEMERKRKLAEEEAKQAEAAKAEAEKAEKELMEAERRKLGDTGERHAAHIPEGTTIFGG